MKRIKNELESIKIQHSKVRSLENQGFDMKIIQWVNLHKYFFHVMRCTLHLFFLEGIKHLCKWIIKPFKLLSMCVLMKMKTFFMIVIKISQFGSFFVWSVSVLGHRLCELVQTLANIVLTHSYKKSYSNHNKEMLLFICSPICMLSQL